MAHNGGSDRDGWNVMVAKGHEFVVVSGVEIEGFIEWSDCVEYGAMPNEAPGGKETFVVPSELERWLE